MTKKPILFSLTLVLASVFLLAPKGCQNQPPPKNEPPRAVIEFTPLVVLVNEPVQFSGAKSSDPDGQIIKYEWDFGDGQTGAGVTVSHTYTAARNYEVFLTVTDDKGSTDKTGVTVAVSIAPNEPPRATFTFTPTSPTVNQPVQFDASASWDPDGSVTQYSWDFGDGGTDQGAKVNHIYNAAGSYKVTLRVTDNRGAVGSQQQTVTVMSEQANKPPVASFTFSPATPKVNQTVQFDASASQDPDGKIVKYEWNFGNGATGTGVKANQTYAQAGSYTVTLTVTDNKGATASTSQTVPVTETDGSGVVSILNAPASEPRGLAWDGQNLWVSDITDDQESFYKINPTDGKVLATLPTPGILPTGLAWDGQNLWNVDAIAGELFKINPSTGDVIESFRVPFDDPTGLTWDGSSLWLADAETGKIYKINPANGKIVSSFNAPGGAPEGLAWDGKNLWHVDVEENKIYKLDTTGRVLSSFDSPAEFPRDLTWDGSHLWLVDSKAKKIYKIAPQ